jgi:tetratricopeptide (TPR) repeat protein
MTGDARASALQDLLIALLAAYQGGEPLAIVVEDAHLMDSPSWSLARRVAQELEPLFLLLACRVQAGDSREEVATSDELALRAAPVTQARMIRPLPREEIAALLCERLAVERVGDSLLDLIEKRAHGHPLFTEEFAWALRDGGWLGTYGGDCELVSGRDLRALDFPETVEGVITTRIDGLSEPLQLCVKVASVLGESFAFTALRDVYPEGADPAGLPDLLGQLVERDVLRLDAEAPERLYSFRHGLVQETAYGRLLYSQREALHARVAEWYEALPGEDAEARTPRTAHHWRLAGAHARAVECLDRAAEMALLQGAFPEAIGFVEQALATEAEAGLAAEAPREARARLTAQRQRVLGDAHYGLGQIVDAAMHLEESLEAMGRPIPRGTLRTLLAIARQAAVQARNRLRGTIARKRPDDAEDRIRAADTVNQLVPIYFILARMTSFLYVCLRALNLAESAGDDREARKLVAEGLAVMSLVTGSARWRSAADRYREIAIALGREVGDPRSLARVFQSAGLYTLGAAQIETCAEGVAEGRALLRDRPGDRRRYEEITGVEAWLGTLQGRYERGVRSWLEIYAGAVRRGDRQSQAVALSGRAEHQFMLARGDYLHGCERLLWEARELLPEQNDVVLDVHFHGLLASIRRRRGNVGDARADLDRAASIMASSEVLPSYGMIAYARVPELYLEMAEAETTTKGRRELRDKGKRALADLRRFAATWPAATPRVLRCEGLLARLAGKEGRARRALEKSLAFAEAHGMPYDEARARFELGQFDAAREIFARIGARHEHDAAARRGVTSAGAG